jgi:hypothetical protein
VNPAAQPLRVQSAGNMDDATFVQHYNTRHLEDAGLGEVRIGTHVAALRAFHKRMHRLATYQHAHRENT